MTMHASYRPVRTGLVTLRVALHLLRTRSFWSRPRGWADWNPMQATLFEPGQRVPGRSPAVRRRAAGAAGFTLVEIMVVVTIISLLAALAVPAIGKVKQKATAAAVGNDLRVFAAALEAYAHEQGGWPAEVDAGVFPPEMATRIKEANWVQPTRIGGQYNWDLDQMHQGTRYKAAIAISSTGSSSLIEDVDLWEAIDRAIDDGVLTTGIFRVGADNEPVFIVSP